MIVPCLRPPEIVGELPRSVPVQAGHQYPGHARRQRGDHSPRTSTLQGSDEQFVPIASAIEHVFGLCKTRQRFLEPDEREGIIADYGVAAAKRCLDINGVSLDEVDLVIGGSIARQYFEPSTAMEVAAKLGLKRTHAFDVTAACVGHLEALQVAAGYLALHDNYRTALVFTSELSGPFLSYDIQTVRDLALKTAGLTIGNAAAC